MVLLAPGHGQVEAGLVGLDIFEELGELVIAPRSFHRLVVLVHLLRGCPGGRGKKRPAGQFFLTAGGGGPGQRPIGRIERSRSSGSHQIDTGVVFGGDSLAPPIVNGPHVADRSIVSNILWVGDDRGLLGERGRARVSAVNHPPPEQVSSDDAK